MLSGAGQSLSSIFEEQERTGHEPSSSSKNEDTTSISEVDSPFEQNHLADAVADGAEDANEISLKEAGSTDDAGVKYTVREGCSHCVDEGVAKTSDQDFVLVEVIFEIGQVNVKLRGLHFSRGRAHTSCQIVEDKVELNR